MSRTGEEWIVMSLGGSLVVPDTINISFLQYLKDIVSVQIKAGKRLFMVVGGGRLSREYQQAARETADLSSSELDWLGIHTTRLNARLLQLAFSDIVEVVIVEKAMDGDDITAPCVISGGWKPGQSTDAVAVEAASHLGAQSVIVLSDIDYIYSADPKKNPDAAPVEEMSWEEVGNLLPQNWEPGQKVPLDSEAIRIARKKHIDVIFMGGHDLSRLVEYLEKGIIQGTYIHSES